VRLLLVCTILLTRFEVRLDLR